MTDELETADLHARPWRRPAVVAAGALVAACLAFIYLAPARDVAKLPTWIPHPGRSLGLDELGGSRVPVELDPSAPAGSVKRAMAVASERIRALGVREPVVRAVGPNRILVEAPGYDDPQRLSAVIGKNGRMTIQMVDADPELGGALPGRVPADEERLPNANPDEPYLVVKKRPIVDGSMLKRAVFSFGSDNAPAVGIQFDETGARRLATATSLNVGNRFAVVLDGKVITAPVIRSPIMGGAGTIGGNFTPQTAQELAMLLNAGPYPSQVTVVEQTRVAPRR